MNASTTSTSSFAAIQSVVSAQSFACQPSEASKLAMPLDSPSYAEVRKSCEADRASCTWSVGQQQITLGDCLTVLIEMATESVDVIVTSPPYNIGVAYRSYEDRRPREGYLAWLAEVGRALRRVLRPMGSLFLNVGSTSVDPWIALSVASVFRDAPSGGRF